MGKRQHQSDKLYITNKEWATTYGGKKNRAISSEFKRLPFDCCSISFQPVEHPVCTRAGAVFELLNVIPFLKKYGVDPTTGEHLDHKQLIRLHFHKNTDGKYHCPVTFKVFNENTHIVAVATTGNVYAMEAIQMLNIKAKNWKDLLTDTPFVRKDIIQIQDPTDLKKFNLTQFHHMKKGLKMENANTAGVSQLRDANKETSTAMDNLKKTEKAWMEDHKKAGFSQPKKKIAAPKDKDHAANWSTGEVSSSFTSTHMDRHTVNAPASIDNDTVRYSKIKSKGYVRIVTNYGPLNFELHCDWVPKTCENFLKHCESGYYKKTIFHRCIRNFMIQGGDPTGSGKGGESAFEGGKAFEDEFQVHLTHSGRGVLSMANSGKNTNKSQFFITFRSCNHLDKKHTVFGQLRGGEQTLLALERTETDDSDRPLKTLKILDTEVFKNPFQELQDKAEATAIEEIEKETAEKEAPKLEVQRDGVGKYLSDSDLGLKNPKRKTEAISSFKTTKKPKSSGFGDFSSW
eukprot:m.127945 g.127945  ORF g.127945 m.127945 type:complete len:515 (-) comp14554_c0_seq7:653-2197(-)